MIVNYPNYDGLFVIFMVYLSDKAKNYSIIIIP